MNRYKIGSFYHIEDENNNQIIYPEVIDPSKLDFQISGINNSFVIKGDIHLLGRIHIHFDGNNNSVTIGENCIIKRNLYLCFYSGGPYFKGDNCSISIADKCNFNGDNISLECGEENSHISIGEDCLFAKNVKLVTSDGHSIFDINSGQRVNVAENIFVGSHVWFCENALILKGSHIKDGSVVACHSVVTNHEYPKNCILGGGAIKNSKKQYLLEVVNI